MQGLPPKGRGRGALALRDGGGAVGAGLRGHEAEEAAVEKEGATIWLLAPREIRAPRTTAPLHNRSAGADMCRWGPLADGIWGEGEYEIAPGPALTRRENWFVLLYTYIFKGPFSAPHGGRALGRGYGGSGAAAGNLL